MEIGLEPSIPTYSGGLGVLAGDTIRSFADLKVPVVAVSLISEKGYFYQKLNNVGEQTEEPVYWNPQDLLELLPEKVSVNIEGREVYIQAWQYTVEGVSGSQVPVLFLDTNIPENDQEARTLTTYLYGGDLTYRLAQEIILGIGGFRMLQKLGYTGIKKYHMNEGHSSLLALEMLRQLKEKREHSEKGQDLWDIEEVRTRCVFTTHTPVPAGHDQFSYTIVEKVLGEFIPWEVLKKLGGQEFLNMTLLALNLSRYVNGVARKHGEISRKMFPGYPIDSITNGVHVCNWTSSSFYRLYERYIQGWCNDPFALRYSLAIPREEIWEAHMESKRKMIDFVNQNTNAGMSYHHLTIGFARRSTAYKRVDLIFTDLQRLASISNKVGKIQLVFAGKAHPSDSRGKELIKKVFQHARELKDSIKIAYLENYNIRTAKFLTSGVDLWLNTPKRPMEASGTSGMKVVMNGIPNFSILDGWWLEGHIEGITGWSIGSRGIENQGDQDERDARELYEKLEEVIVPQFYYEREKWIDVMRHSIAVNGSFFNTHRMVYEYTVNAYFL
ncbi:alpha-glucan family phosphorylase [Candidatus Contubernalis alkalaceticus]|nr:alpha-glucan family phosphorylase [Candidatus Contubernalis alkalaceticus]